MAVSASQSWYTLAYGYLEYLATDANIYDSLCFSSSTGPAKSNWTSSFGSVSCGSSEILFFGINGFKYLPILIHGWQFCVSYNFPVYSWEPD